MTQEDDSLRRARELVARSIAEYRSNRLKYYLQRPRLLEELLTKDPLLPALKGVTTATGWLTEAFNAHESSSEETVMGNAWQQILTDLSEHSVGAGDLLIEKEGMLWVLEIKSSPVTLNGPGLAQTLKVLQQKKREQSRSRTPRQRGIQPMIGVVRGTAFDGWKNYPGTSPADQEIKDFQYRQMVGAPFRSWLTGIANLAGLVEDPDGGAEIALARKACRERLQKELMELLAEKGLPDDIASIMQLVSEKDELPPT